MNIPTQAKAGLEWALVPGDRAQPRHAAGLHVTGWFFLVYTGTGVWKDWFTLPRAIHRHTCSIDDFACRTFRFGGHGLYCAHDHAGEQAGNEPCSCDSLHRSFLLCVKFDQSLERQAGSASGRRGARAVAGLHAGVIRQELRRRFRGLRREAS